MVGSSGFNLGEILEKTFNNSPPASRLIKKIEFYCGTTSSIWSVVGNPICVDLVLLDVTIVMLLLFACLVLSNVHTLGGTYGNSS